MTDKLKKIDKEFLLTDNSVNTYGFRLLTEGYQLNEYKKNPIGYNMHLRDAGVLVKWEDFRTEGDAVYAKPVINLSNARGQQTVDEIENGFLNAASLGHFVVLESSNEDSLKLPNQKGPTVTKWFNRECSLVDIPGNFNALKLYDKNDNEINLASFTKNNTTVEKIFLTPEQLTKLNLKADAKQNEIEVVIDNLMAEAAKVPGLTQQLNAANTAKETAETALTALKATTVEKEVAEMIAGGLTAKKINAKQGEVLKTQYAGKPTELKALLDATPVYTGLTAFIENEAGAEELTALVAKEWDVLDKEGKLERLKELSAEQFAAKYKAKFNKEYTK